MRDAVLRYYSPSVISQLLMPLAAISAVLFGSYWAWSFRLDGLLAGIVVISAAFVATAVAAYAYCYRLELHSASQSLRIQTRSFGLAIREQVVPYHQVRSLTLHCDGDAFSSIRLETFAAGTYWFHSRKTEVAYEQLTREIDPTWRFRPVRSGP